MASNYQLSCRTTAAPYPSYVVNRLLLSVDNANFSLASPYLYTNDPTIQRIEPLQSFFSGGNQIVVTGSQFSSIQQPRMVVLARRNRMTANLRSGSSWPSAYHKNQRKSGELINTDRFINDSVKICIFI